MSRVAKNPVVIPKGVDIKIDGGVFSAKKGKNELFQKIHPAVKIIQEDSLLKFEKNDKEYYSDASAQCGTCRALVNNIMIGLTEGFEKRLSLVGVGYRAQLQGKKLNLTLGFSHPVVYNLPDGISVELPSQTEIVIKGISAQLVGQVASEIRAYRPPEPYKGKGVRYKDEHIIRKEGKKK